ncbi:cellulose biosynthesis cyclic di-GMP-binding regulatory protein BcsB [Rhizobium sp. SAFR-030]|uniref:cellulose biosynthesis cyclic di-GMP-binding regulatory protein BcsB n=1 Tax=Rhizobium sp. SAFR-030 TaxID=3387277 RepID=UPI003F80C9F4
MRLVTTSLALLTLVLLSQTATLAQVPTFDMSGERPPQAPAAPPLVIPQLNTPQRPSPPTLVPPPRPTSITPTVSRPQAGAPTPDQPAVPQRAQIQVQPQPVPQEARPATTPPTRQTVDVSPADRRYLIPSDTLTLTGELDRSRFSVYLTPEQAAAAATFHVGFQNSIVAAPEASRLQVLVNDRPVGEMPVDSSENVRSTQFRVPQGLLQSGSNLIEFRVNQRHRTDCDVRSTYDLWTTVKPDQTFLSFDGAVAQTSSVSEAVKALGVDASGRTRLRIVAPALGQSVSTNPLIRLSQGLSLLSGLPRLSFDYRTGTPEPSQPGEMTLYVGTFAELQPLLPAMPAAAQSAAVTAIASPPGSSESVMVISGPSWANIEGAIDTVIASADRPSGVRRDVITTQRWSAPDAPLLFGGQKLPLSQFGLQTTEFSGRRMRLNFGVAVPADFYANAYGEAELLVDAAFTESVQPGSHIDVYVNENIASSTPLYARSGGVLRHQAVKIPLRHMRAGVNSIGLEVVINAPEDQACVPGSSASTTPRFALFDTSEFSMPNFARIGRSPNLEALAGTGYPYNTATSQPVLVALDRLDPDMLSIASTFFGRVSVMAGRVIKIDAAAPSSSFGNRDAVFIGPISQIPQKALQQVNLPLNNAAAWRPGQAQSAQAATSSASIDDWSAKLGGGALSGRISGARDWFERNFDMSFDRLSVLPSAELPFQPTANQTLILAQSRGDAGNGTWTVVTAPDTGTLRSGVEAVTMPENWQKVTGRLVAYNEKAQTMAALPVSRVSYIETAPASLDNYRMVMANWLSTNILIYSVALIVLLMLLGVFTSSLLSKFGRRK